MTADPELVYNFRDLLRRTDCETLEDLADTLNDYVDFDTFIESGPDDEAEFSVRIDATGFSLEYPFQLRALWDGLDELEGELIDHMTREEIDDFLAAETEHVGHLVRRYLEPFMRQVEVRSGLRRRPFSRPHGRQHLRACIATSNKSEVAYVILRPVARVRIRVDPADVIDVDPSLRVWSSSASQPFPLECTLDSARSVQLALKLTKQALRKPYRHRRSIHNAVP